MTEHAKRKSEVSKKLINASPFESFGAKDTPLEDSRGTSIFEQ